MHHLKGKNIKKKYGNKEFHMPIPGHSVCLDPKLSIPDLRPEAEVIIPLQIYVTDWTFYTT
jgi:hypothetical protein